MVTACPCMGSIVRMHLQKSSEHQLCVLAAAVPVLQR